MSPSTREGQREMDNSVTHLGSCHCGDVRFEVEAPERLELLECNCSICDRTGFLHLVVPKERFRLTTDWDALSTYTFNTGVAKHLFCKRCGIKSFYVPRSHPDGYSVNARCLSPERILEQRIRPFDGAHWETHIGEIAGYSS